jgi:hypothetical protein
MQKGLPALVAAVLLAAIAGFIIASRRPGEAAPGTGGAGPGTAAKDGAKTDPADPGTTPGGPGNTETAPSGGDPVKPTPGHPDKTGSPAELREDREVDDFALLPPLPGTADDWHRLVIDRAADPRTRVHALHALRINEPGRRTEDVVVAMLDLLGRTDDLALRIGICRNLKGVESAAMRDEMIARLQSDPNEFVRRQAANTLGPLADHAAVRAALEHAKANDESRHVRNQASASLGSR